MGRNGISGILALALIAADPVGARASGASRHDVVRGALKAAVEVLVDGQLKGGGGIVREDGLIITAAHIFGNPAAKFEVITAEDGRLSVELLAFDKGHDLALLKLDAPGGKGGPSASYPVLPVAKAIPAVGSPVYNLSMALRNRGVVMEGMVAQEATVFNELAETNGYVENFFVSGMTPSLTSGGVWINGKGEIAGVQSARLNDGHLKSGIAMVAPPGAITALIKRGKTASTPGIGGWVWEVWTADRNFLRSIPEGTEGLVITWIRLGGPMDKAGLERLDVILACDGEKVVRRPDLLRLVRARKPGEKVRLTVLKPNVEGTTEVEVELQDLEKFWMEVNSEKGEEG